MKNLSVREYFTRWMRGEDMNLAMCNGFRCTQRRNFMCEIRLATTEGLVPVVGRTEGGYVYNEMYAEDIHLPVLMSVVGNKKLEPTTLQAQFADVMTLSDAVEMFPY